MDKSGRDEGEAELAQFLKQGDDLVRALVEHTRSSGAGAMQQVIVDDQGTPWTVIVTSRAIPEVINMQN